MKKLKKFLANLNKAHTALVLSSLLFLGCFFLSKSEGEQHNLKFIYNYKVYEEEHGKIKLDILSSMEFSNNQFSVMQFSSPGTEDSLLLSFDAKILDRNKNKFEFCSYNIAVKNTKEAFSESLIEKHFFDMSQVVTDLKRDSSRPISVEFFSEDVVLITGGFFNRPTLISRSYPSET
ncbi:TPA: hypothetical protein ACRZ2J_002227 [Vibrio campbellii]